MRKLAAAMAVATGMALLVSPGTAQAMPTVCKAGINRYMPRAPDKGSASCEFGSGTYRLRLGCAAGLGVPVSTYYGQWRTGGTTASAATCPQLKPYGMNASVQFA